MPAALLAGLVIGAVVAGAIGSIRTGFTLVVATTFLVPAGLQFPYGISTYLDVQRLVLVAVLLRLLLGLRRGEIPSGSFRATPAHLALAGYVAVAYVDGVLLADRTIPPAVAFDGWLVVADQLLFLVVVLTALRTLGDPGLAARVIVAVGAVAALIAVWEHFSREPYALKVFFDELTEQAAAPGARPIERRGGDVRVRAAAGFALAFAWIAASLVPLAIAVAAWGRRLWMVVPGLLVVAVLWTYSRSALAGLLIGAVVLVVATRFQGRPTRLVIAGGVAAALVLAGTSTLGRTFDEVAAEGSEAVRLERLPVVLEAAADSPLVGDGFGAVTNLGFAGTDASYVSTYVELGALGLTALVLMLIVSLWVVSAGLRTPFGPDRALAAAAVAAVVMAVVGAGAFDLFPPTQSSRPFWLLVGLGAFVAECGGHVWRLELRPRRVLAAAIAGLALGVGVLAVAPQQDTATYRFQALGIESDARATEARGFVARLHHRSACQALELLDDDQDLQVTCTPVPAGLDLAQVRLAVPAGQPLGPAIELARSTLEAVLGRVDAALVGTEAGARPSWARTATVWAPAGAVVLAMLAPRPRRTR